LFCLYSIERFPTILFSIAEVNIRFIHMYRVLAIFYMYFELIMVKHVYLGFSSHGFTYWWILFFSAHCKQVPCNTLTHSTNADLLKKSANVMLNLGPSLVRPIPLKPGKVILLACSTYPVYWYFQILLNLFWHTDKHFCLRGS
jgi:hypothetical protein